MGLIRYGEALSGRRERPGDRSGSRPLRRQASGGGYGRRCVSRNCIKHGRAIVPEEADRRWLRALACEEAGIRTGNGLGWTDMVSLAALGTVMTKQCVRKIHTTCMRNGRSISAFHGAPDHWRFLKKSILKKTIRREICHFSKTHKKNGISGLL